MHYKHDRKGYLAHLEQRLILVEGEVVINLHGAGDRQLAPEKQQISKSVVRGVLQWATNHAKPETLVCIRHLKLILKILCRPSLHGCFTKEHFPNHVCTCLYFSVVHVSSFWLADLTQSHLLHFQGGRWCIRRSVPHVGTIMSGTYWVRRSWGALTRPDFTWCFLVLGTIDFSWWSGKVGGCWKPSERPQEKNVFPGVTSFQPRM